VKLLAANLLLNPPDRATGRVADPHDKLLAAVEWARWAEEVGFDSVGIKAGLELFLDRAAPVLRAQLPSRVWAGTGAAA
jgi:hypothetical protein